MDCRFCTAPLPAPFLDLGDQPAGAETIEHGSDPVQDHLMPLRIAACSRCHLVQLAGPMAPGAGIDHGHGVAASTTLMEHERRWAGEMAAGLPLTKRAVNVLDVSSGGGALLREMERSARVGARLETLGFEANPHLAQTARQAGTPTIAAGFDRSAAADLVARGWQADLVVANHALAHADDPRGFMEAIASVLAPGGRLAIETTHLLGIVRDGLFDTVNHAHATYPSMQSLIALVQLIGLEVVEARWVDVHGGAIRLIARAPRAADSGRPSGLRGRRLARRRSSRENR